MADVSKEPRHYPKILELNLIESAIELYSKTYSKVQKQYIHNVKKGFSKKAKADLKTMDDMNAQLIKDFYEVEQLIGEVYPLGIENQHIIRKKNPQLRAMGRQLNADRDYINSVIKQNDNLDGEFESTKLENRTLYIQYIIMIILLIIVAALTLRAFTVPNSNAIETIILIAAFALIIYFIYEKYF